MKYRPEIDGLRAFAVVPVILFHAGFTLFSGGFVGVDVFFVISGYLITSIIIEALEKGQFSLFDFYERRARRILPALVTVTVAASVVAWLWMTPVQLKEFGQSVAATFLFSSNILFWSQSGYFAPSSELNPMLHTWSLAVEEQFYVVFPLLIVAIARFRLKSIVPVIALIGLISFMTALYMVQHAPSAAFFLLPARAWELLVGSLLAIYLRRFSQPSGIAATTGALIGLALLAYAVVFFDASVPFPSAWTLFPVLGTGLIILCARCDNLPGVILSHRTVVLIGLLSYSAYLWHQPIFAFTRIHSDDQPSVLLLLGLSALSFALAALSWRFVERPFRDRAFLTRKTVLQLSAGISITMLAFGATLHLANGVPDRLSTGARLATAETYFLPDSDCIPQKLGAYSGCVYRADANRIVALWGDSHGMVWAQSLADALAPLDVGIVNATLGACLPAIGIEREGRNCSDEQAAIFAYLQSPESPDTIIITARWALYLNGKGFDNCEGGVENQKDLILSELNGIRNSTQSSIVTNAIRRTIQRLRDINKKVVIIEDIPEMGWNIPDRIFRNEMFATGIRRPVSVARSCYDNRTASSRDVFAPFVNDLGVVFVDPSEVFCDGIGVDTGRCLAEWDGVPLYFDDDHLSSTGAKNLAQAALPAIARALADDTPPTPGR